MLTRRNKYGVEKRRALPFIVVVRDNARAFAHCLPFSVDLPATWANDPGGRLTRSPDSTNSFDLEHVKSITNKNGDAARGDRGLLGREEYLRKGGIDLAMVWAEGLLWDDAVYVDSNSLCEIVVNVVK